MSAFLAPIHFWLYNKIALQEELINDIIDCARHNKWDERLNGETVESYSCGELPALESVIDTDNIHGWLQSRIRDCESRYAKLLIGLLAIDPERLNQLKQVAYDFGTHHAIDADADAQDAFKVMNDSLLDGMPCDHVNSLLTDSSEEVSWERTQNLHAQYWTNAGGDSRYYDVFRTQIIYGLISHTNLRYLCLTDDKYAFTFEQ